MITKVCPKRQYEIFQSIVAKFLLNLPLQQRKQQSRLSYHAEKAWYYYLDSVLQVKDDSGITSEEKYAFFQKLRTFSPKSLNINPDLIVSKLSENKPTCGAIILNEAQTKVLVIKNKSDQLGFPKGKWNQSQKQESCAAREVYEEIGIYIHSKIDSSQKMQFMSYGNVPTIFFVVKGVKQNEKFNIDKKEISDVFWMGVNEVTRQIRRFVSKSRSAWKIYLDEFSEPKLTIERFINHYKPKETQSRRRRTSLQRAQKQSQKQKSNLLQQEQNPLLSFKLNREKLMKVFAN